MQTRAVRLRRNVQYHTIDDALRVLLTNNGRHQPKSLICAFSYAVECVLASGALWVWSVASDQELAAGDSRGDRGSAVRISPARPAQSSVSPALQQASVATFGGTVDVVKVHSTVLYPPQSATGSHPNTKLGGMHTMYMDVELDTDVREWDDQRHTVALMTQRVVQNENNRTAFGIQWLYFGMTQVVRHTPIAPTAENDNIPGTTVVVRLDVSLLASLCCLAQHAAHRQRHNFDEERVVLDDQGRSNIYQDSQAPNNIYRMACAVDIWRHYMYEQCDDELASGRSATMFYALLSWEDAVRRNIRTCNDNREDVWVNNCFRTFYEQYLYKDAFLNILSPTLWRNYRQRSLSPSSTYASISNATDVQNAIMRNIEWFIHIVTNSSDAAILDVVVATAIHQTWPLCIMPQSRSMVPERVASMLGAWVAARSRPFFVHLLHYWIPVSHCDNVMGAERIKRTLLSWFVDHSNHVDLLAIVCELCSRQSVPGTSVAVDTLERHALRDIHPPGDFIVDVRDATTVENSIIDAIQTMTRALYTSAETARTVTHDRSVHYNMILFLHNMYNIPQQLFSPGPVMVTHEEQPVADTAWVIMYRMLGLATGYQSLDRAFCAIVSDTDFMRMFCLWVQDSVVLSQPLVNDVRFVYYMSVLLTREHSINEQSMDRTLCLAYPGFATSRLVFHSQWDIASCWFFVAYVSPSLDILGNEENHTNFRQAFLNFMLHTILEPFGSDELYGVREEHYNWWDFVITAWNDASPHKVPLSSSVYWSAQSDLRTSISEFVRASAPAGSVPNLFLVGLLSAMRDFVYSYPRGTQLVHAEQNIAAMRG